MSDIDINICYSAIGDKYVGLKTVLPITEVFRYRHQNSFRYPTFKKKVMPSGEFKPVPLRLISEHFTYKLRSLLLKFDVGYRIKLYSDIMLDSALSVRYRKFRYQAQSDIADHGYRTKCPPMVTLYRSPQMIVRRLFDSFKCRKPTAGYSNSTKMQCCGAGAARSRNFSLEPEPEYRSFGSGSAKVVFKKSKFILNRI
jgi:hypothetical protein